MKPRDFAIHPYSSVFQKTETEIVARNIMVILGRTGNEWRELIWDEYVVERAKDGAFDIDEQDHFRRASPYTISAEQAAKFSPIWNDVLKAENL